MCPSLQILDGVVSGEVVRVARVRGLVEVRTDKLGHSESNVGSLLKVSQASASSRKMANSDLDRNVDVSVRLFYCLLFSMNKGLDLLFFVTLSIIIFSLFLVNCTLFK